MSEIKDGSSSCGESYVSCMKLNGVPLLPPLMTPECRQEMQYYKQLAVAVERRISDLKFYLDETTINSNVMQSDSEEWFDGVNISIVSSKSDHNIDMSDYPRYEYLNATYGAKATCVDNNDFESMNSQLTVIDTNDDYLSEMAANLDKTPVNPVNSQHSIGNEAYREKPTDESHFKLDASSYNVKGSVRNPQPIDLNSSSKQEHSKFAKNFLIKNDSTKSIHVASRSGCSSSKSSSKLASVTKSTKNIKNNATRNDNAALPKAATFKKSTFFDSKDLLNLKKIPKKSSAFVNSAKLSPSKNVTGSLNNISSGLTSPPKLVRQNSYTLEYPSPLLLAHLEVQSLASGVELHSISMSESTSTSHLNKQKSLDSNKAKDIWSSVGSDINSLSLNENSALPSLSYKENSDLSDKKVSTLNLGCENKLELQYDKQPSTKQNTIQSLTSSKMSSLNISSDEKVKEGEFSPRVDSPVSDKTNSTVMSNTETNDAATSLPLDVSKCSISTSSNVCLKYILKKFEEDHEKKLVELINKQKEEQLVLQKAFENQQKLLLEKFQNTSKNNIESNTANDSVLNVENSKSLKEGNTTFTRQSTEATHLSKEMPNIYNNVGEHSIKIQSDDVDRYLKISEKVLLKSRHLRGQKSTLPETPIKINVPDVAQPKDSPLLYNNKLTEVQFRRSDNLGLDYKNGESSEARSICSVNDRNDLDENILTARSANTLDDINSTFALDDVSSGSETKTNVSIPIGDVDGMSKLKSAFDKITKIQQNLASQPSYRYPINFTNDRIYRQDDYDHQTVSLSSISTVSQLNCEPENHYSIADRNSLSLNLTDVNRPHNSKHSQDKVGGKYQKLTEKEICAATTIVAYAKGFLTRRLMRTEKVESIVQTVRDTLFCALQLHRDERGIQGADVDLHRRLIQQITAACYALHDTFIVFTAAERMSIIAQDRERKISLSHRSSSSVSSVRQLSATTQKILKRKLEGMSKSHSGVFTNRSHRHLSSNLMTRSHYDHNDLLKGGLSYRPRRTITVSGELGGSRKPWR